MNIHLSVIAASIIALSGPMVAFGASGMVCTMQYDPVCGTQNGIYKTYGNGCVAASEGATFQHQGECTAAELSGRGEGTYTPPAHCTAWFDGCNQCSRGANGQGACTLRACLTLTAGYCTAYGESTTDSGSGSSAGNGSGSVSGVGVSVSVDAEQSADEEAQTETEATTTPEKRPNFAVRIWTSIVAWFAGLF